MPLLKIEPTNLTFRFELMRRASCTIRLSNTSPEQRVAFKNLEKYFASVSYGILLPGSSCDVKVTTHAPTEIPPYMQCRDEFSIKSVVASPRTTVENCRNLFNDRNRLVEVHPLGVVYVQQSSNSQGRRGRNTWHDGNLFVKSITFVLLCFIFGYLITKMLQFIWTLVFVIVVFVMKMATKHISDSVEEWINRTLLYLCMQFLPAVLGTPLYRCIDYVAASCETMYNLCIRFLTTVFEQG